MEAERYANITEAIAMVAPVDCAVLLLGETGSGKELIARAIHARPPPPSRLRRSRLKEELEVLGSTGPSGLETSAQIRLWC